MLSTATDSHRMIPSVPVLVPVRESAATALEVLVWKLLLVAVAAESDRSVPRKGRPARRERKQGKPS